MTRPVEMSRAVIVAALGGDPAALSAVVAGSASPSEWIVRNRLAPALACTAMRAGIGLPPAWHRILQLEAARELVLGGAMQGVSRVLGDLAVPWIALKGMDLRYRLFQDPLERPTSDLDVLVSPRDHERSRAALISAGWKPAQSGAAALEYEREEGYNWQAYDATGVLLELHFRLWAAVEEAFTVEASARSAPVAHYGPAGRALGWLDALIVSAFHYWLSPTLRFAATLWEIKLLVDKLPGAEALPSLKERVVRHGLQLPVCLAFRDAARFIDEPPLCAAAKELARVCSPLERAALGLEGRLKPEFSFRFGYLARLLSGRPARMRWKVVWRQVRPHAGIRV